MALLFVFVVLASGAPLTASMGREHYALIDAFRNLEKPEFTVSVRMTLSGFAGRWLTEFDLNSPSLELSSSGEARSSKPG